MGSRAQQICLFVDVIDVCKDLSNQIIGVEIVQFNWKSVKYKNDDKAFCFLSCVVLFLMRFEF